VRGIASWWLAPEGSTSFKTVPSVLSRSRSAMPEANTASVSGSKTENFREELPLLMTRIEEAKGTSQEWPTRLGLVNPGAYCIHDRRVEENCIPPLLLFRFSGACIASISERTAAGEGARWLRSSSLALA
jgi:hypothetical protein